MAAPMKAIETQYNGYHFRSRLEARWAVFFDTLKIPYEYEPEGYELADGLRYLPDFWLPDQRCWVEIKPGSPNEEEIHKCILLAQASGSPVFILTTIGVPTVHYSSDGYGEIARFEHFHLGIDERDIESHEYFFDGLKAWGECTICTKIGIGHLGSHDACSCADGWNPDCTDTPTLRNAYRAARSARFEFGQSG